jgi:ankyrin repeat protein
MACYNSHSLAVVNTLLLSPNDTSNGATSRAGANMEAKDYEGKTPLHLDSSEGLVAIAQALLRVGANILAADNKGKLPIHFAMNTVKSLAVVKCLLHHIYATIGCPRYLGRSHFG